MMRLFPVLLLSFCMMMPHAAHANKRAELQRVEADLKTQRAQEASLKTEQQNLSKKLDEVRRDLMRMTRDIQGHERALLKIENRRDATQKQFAEAQQKLNMRRDSLAQLIVALQRLSRLPPQALLARPTAPIDTARSYNMLQQVIPGVSSQAKDIKVILDELLGLQATLDAQQADLKKEYDALKTKRVALEKAVKERQALLKKTQHDHETASRNVARLAGQAKDLRGLLETITRQHNEREKDRAKAIPRDRPLTGIGTTLKAWLGAPNLPVVGDVKTSFNQTMPGGGKSQGISIRAASGAMVTAPHAGVVRFAGPFRQYKLLVIIQHPNGEHSLLGGMQELYTKAGDRVAAGEPIGKLSDEKMEGDSTRSASLYYERRRNGKPIDPRSAKG